MSTKRNSLSGFKVGMTRAYKKPIPSVHARPSLRWRWEGLLCNNDGGTHGERCQECATLPPSATMWIASHYSLIPSAAGLQLFYRKWLVKRRRSTSRKWHQVATVHKRPAATRGICKNKVSLPPRLLFSVQTSQLGRRPSYLHTTRAAETWEWLRNSL